MKNIVLIILALNILVACNSSTNQVKNSDNSENAASSRVRVGTNIIKWFRRLSKVKNKDNWSELIKIIKSNDKELIENLSEKNYLNYLKS